MKPRMRVILLQSQQYYNNTQAPMWWDNEAQNIWACVL